MAGLKDLMASRKRYASGGKVDGGHSTQVGPMGRSSAPTRAGGGHDPARYAGRTAPHDTYFLARGGSPGGFSSEVGPRPVPHPPSVPGGGHERYAGGPPPHDIATRYFAHGGEADGPEVSPELKLAAFELLECLDSGRYGADGKGGRAEAFAKHLLAFVHLADEMPHAEGEHEEGGEGEDGEYEDGDGE